MAQISKKQQAADRELFSVWLLGGAFMAFVWAGLADWFEGGEHLAPAGFLLGSLILLGVHVFRHREQGVVPMSRILAYLAADIAWMLLVIGPWVLCAAACLLVALLVIFQAVKLILS